MGVKLKSPNGMDAMELKWLKHDEKSDTLQMKGVALGTMPIVVEVTPEQLYEVYKMIDGKTIKAAGKMFFKGRKLAKQKD